MTDINTKGMEVAQLTEEQLHQILQTEKLINENTPQEIYLLAVQRHE